MPLVVCNPFGMNNFLQKTGHISNIMFLVFIIVLARHVDKRRPSKPTLSRTYMNTKMRSDTGKR